jgi:hypothetical protein
VWDAPRGAAPLGPGRRCADSSLPPPRTDAGFDAACRDLIGRSRPDGGNGKPREEGGRSIPVRTRSPDQIDSGLKNSVSVPPPSRALRVWFSGCNIFHPQRTGRGYRRGTTRNERDTVHIGFNQRLLFL